jgi:hypothetical protein
VIIRQNQNFVEFPNEAKAAESIDNQRLLLFGYLCKA